MWPGRRTPLNPNLLCEIVLRAILLLSVSALQTHIEPNEYITDREILGNYKLPRCDSLVPAWAMVVIVIVLPLSVFTYATYVTGEDGDSVETLLSWTLAIAINALVTESIKIKVGRARPDFFYRCFPNGEMTNELKCTGTMRDVTEGRKSFPSGHSSFAFCSLGFISIWMGGKMRVCHGFSKSNAIKCVVPLMLASFVAVSRVYDNHHHWGDVFVGSLIGIVSAYVCYRLYYNALSSCNAGLPYAVTRT